MEFYNVKSEMYQEKFVSVPWKRWKMAEWNKNNVKSEMFQEQFGSVPCRQMDIVTKHCHSLFTFITCRNVEDCLISQNRFFGIPSGLVK